MLLNILFFFDDLTSSQMTSVENVENCLFFPSSSRHLIVKRETEISVESVIEKSDFVSFEGNTNSLLKILTLLLD